MISVLCLVVLIGISHPQAAERQMYPPWPPEGQASAWELRKDEDGSMYMTRHFPYGAVDRWLTIYPGGSSSSPKSGMCRFSNGLTTAMTAGELNYFWDFAGAKHAWESYRNQRR